MPPRFSCFEMTIGITLRDNYELIVKNARDRDRSSPLEIWSTQSKGYDYDSDKCDRQSNYGIDKVFSVSEAQKHITIWPHSDKGKLPDDDGGEICNFLGLRCVRINRRAFADEFDDEYLYYSGLHHNQDFNLKEISKHISEIGVLLTGTLGEIWYPMSSLGSRAYLDPNLRRWDLGGHGMAELRLVVGFIHLPLPYIGARQKEDIVQVTESSEMDPWRLKNAYDRPIPRRIAEEAGVPRSMFGQSKMGSVVIFAPPAIPYGRDLRRRFFEFLAREKIMGRFQSLFWPVVREVNAILMLKSEQRFAVVYYAERLISRLMGHELQFPMLWSNLDGALFCFCVNNTAAKYARAVSGLKGNLQERLNNAIA